jgi:hypothetical protein
LDQSDVFFTDFASGRAAPDRTLSRTLFQDARLKIVLFGFAAGQVI